jgi:hypothetical protein
MSDIDELFDVGVSTKSYNDKTQNWMEDDFVIIIVL